MDRQSRPSQIDVAFDTPLFLLAVWMQTEQRLLKVYCSQGSSTEGRCSQKVPITVWCESSLTRYVFLWISLLSHCCVLQVHNDPTLLCLFPGFPVSLMMRLLLIFCRSSDRGKDWYLRDQFWASIGCRHGKTIFFFVSNHMLFPNIVHAFWYYSTFSYPVPLSVSLSYSLLSGHSTDVHCLPKSFSISLFFTDSLCFQIFRINQNRGYHENEVLTIIFICFVFYLHWYSLSSLYFDMECNEGGLLSSKTSIIPASLHSMVYFSWIPFLFFFFLVELMNSIRC